MSEKHFKVKLKRSGTGMPADQKRTLVGLGLSRFGREVFLKDTPPIRGMLYKVVHLVDVEPQDGPVPQTSARARARALAK